MGTLFTEFHCGCTSMNDAECPGFQNEITTEVRSINKIVLEIGLNENMRDS